MNTTQVYSSTSPPQPQAPPPPYQGYVMPQNSMPILGTYPTQCVCICCKQTVMTRIEKKNGLATWGSVAILCFIGCCLGCCLIPFCVDSLKNTVHHCPNCGYVVGEQRVI